MGALGYLHGVEIISENRVNNTVETISTSVICVIGSAKTGELYKPVVFRDGAKIKEVFGEAREADGEKVILYTLPDALENIYMQTNGVVICIPFSNTGVNATDIKWTETKPEGIDKAIDLIAKLESLTGFKPAILIAPGFSKNSEVAAKLVVAANSIRASVVQDENDDPDAVKEPNTISARIYPVTPWVKKTVMVKMAPPPLNPSNPATPPPPPVSPKEVKKTYSSPPSGFVAGGFARSDVERGWWHSPSNFALNGIAELSNGVGFSISDKNCQANLLNQKGIAVIINQKGFRVWGNRHTSSDAECKFISVTRTLDVIDESIIRAHMTAVDRSLSKVYFDSVTGNVNAYFKELKSLGAITDALCLTDKENNTVESLKNGEAHFILDVTPAYPAEHIVFRRRISDNSLLEVIK